MPSDPFNDDSSSVLFEVEDKRHDSSSTSPSRAVGNNGSQHRNNNSIKSHDATKKRSGSGSPETSSLNDDIEVYASKPSTAKIVHHHHFKPTSENPFADDADNTVLLMSQTRSDSFAGGFKPESSFLDHPLAGSDDDSTGNAPGALGANSAGVDFDELPPAGRLKGMKLLYFTSAFVSLGVFVFGYDQGVMSGIITERTFVQYFDEPTKSQIGTVVAILEVGALCSSLSVGKIGDSLGRKKTILLGALVFVLGGLMQCLSNKIFVLILGRVVSGISIGLLSATVPMYQTEISPPSSRGRLGCIQFSGNICGYMASVWVDYSCSFNTSQVSWRLPLFLQSALGCFLFIGGLFIVESPRWLLEKDRDAQGYKVLNLLFADSPRGTAQKEFELIKNSILEDRISSPPHMRTYKVMFKKYWYRVMITCTALMWAQINGINVVCYYAPMLFEAAGFKNRAALLVTGLNSIVYLLATIPSWFLVDNWGRKPILMTGGFCMGVCLLVIAFAEFLNTGASPVVVAIFVVIYMALFAMSWGPIPWLMCEILPLQVRAKGVSLSTATNWVFNYLVGQMTPILLDKIKYRLYLMHGIFCLCSVGFVWRFFPETRGVELEDMDKLFNDNYQQLDVRVGDEDDDNDEFNDDEDENVELHTLNDSTHHRTVV